MDAVRARMRAAVELRELTIALHRQQLRRRHPERTREWIEARLAEWVMRSEQPESRAPVVGRLR